MLSWTALRAVCLTSLLLSWITYFAVAVPIPIKQIDHTTRMTSNTDGLHHQRLQAHAALPPNHQAHPGQVVLHQTPTPPGAPPPPRPHPHSEAGHGHLTGTVVADPRNQHHMSGTALAAHVNHIQNQIPNGHLYKIDAHHTPGNAHVLFHATPLHHDPVRGRDQNGVLHAVLNPGDNPQNDHPDVRSTRGHRLAIHQEVDAKIQSGAAGHGTRQIPGGGMIGRIPIARDEHRNGMTAPDLQAHAHYVHHLVTENRPELSENVHVHVNHKRGEGHVDFHVIPGQRTVSEREIEAHLDHHGDGHYTGAPITRSRNANPQDPRADHKYTWHGSVPAHTTGQMSPGELRVYAQRARDRIVALNGLQGVDANDMVMAAVHKEGDTHVRFHTQPMHSLVMNRNQGVQPGPNGHGQRPDPLAAKLNTEMVTANPGRSPWHHAETGALYDALQAKGVHNNMASFDQEVQGHTIGVAGAWNQPCPQCKRTLNRLGVNY